MPPGGSRALMLEEWGLACGGNQRKGDSKAPGSKGTAAKSNLDRSFPGGCGWGWGQVESLIRKASVHWGCAGADSAILKNSNEINENKNHKHKTSLGVRLQCIMYVLEAFVLVMSVPWRCYITPRYGVVTSHR